MLNFFIILCKKVWLIICLHDMMYISSIGRGIINNADYDFKRGTGV